MRHSLKIYSCVYSQLLQVRGAALPDCHLPNREDYGVWRETNVSMWLPHCLRMIRSSYNVFISLDLPSQVLDIVKSLTTELRVASLNNILTSVVEETYILHEREDWQLVMSDNTGAITNLPALYQVTMTDLTNCYLLN